MVGTLLSDEKAAALVAPLLLALMMASGDASPRLPLVSRCLCSFVPSVTQRT